MLFFLLIYLAIYALDSLYPASRAIIIFPIYINISKGFSCTVVKHRSMRAYKVYFRFFALSIYYMVLAQHHRLCGPAVTVHATDPEVLGSIPGLENRDYDRGDPLHWPRDTLYQQKLVLTTPTSGGRSVDIVRLRAEATEYLAFFLRCCLPVDCIVFHKASRGRLTYVTLQPCMTAGTSVRYVPVLWICNSSTPALDSQKDK
jgi:hypothetical protein